MFLSVFDIFKLGIGPSSSHTMGPMVAAGRFLDLLRNGADRIPGAGEAARLGARLHGSLAFTGKGHATDRAVILGLAGFGLLFAGGAAVLFGLERGPDEDAIARDLGVKVQAVRLTAAGYVYIGMDHFAKPDDELAMAQQAGTLYRNFQGYSTHADCDLIGLGATSIGMVGDSYSQNRKTLEDYYARIDEGRLAVFRGVRLDADDRLRRAVITDLICHFSLDFATVERRFDIGFRDYFAAELAELADLQADGLLKLSETGIRVLPPGRLLIRNICMVFDRYLRDQRQQRFSRVI